MHRYKIILTITGLVSDPLKNKSPEKNKMTTVSQQLSQSSFVYNEAHRQLQNHRFCKESHEMCHTVFMQNIQKKPRYNLPQSRNSPNY